MLRRPNPLERLEQYIELNEKRKQENERRHQDLLEMMLRIERRLPPAQEQEAPRQEVERKYLSP